MSFVGWGDMELSTRIREVIKFLIRVGETQLSYLSKGLGWALIGESSMERSNIYG